MSLDQDSKLLEFIQAIRLTPENLRNSTRNSDHRKGLPQPSYEKKFDDSIKLVDLPSVNSIKVNEISLKEAILNRRSIRNFNDKPISKNDLSWLLYATQGIQSIHEKGTIWVTRNNDCRVTLRPVASGGSLHPFETYIHIRNCEDIEKGLYRYIASKHKLLPLDLSEDIEERITKACLANVGRRSQVLFIWTAVPYRTGWHYGELAYKAVYWDIGHVSQNLYLAAEGVDCGVCAIGYYDEDRLDEILDIDGKTEFVIFMSAVGKKPDKIIDP